MYLHETLLVVIANTNGVWMLNVIKLITELVGPLYTRNSQVKKFRQTHFSLNEITNELHKGFKYQRFIQKHLKFK